MADELKPDIELSITPGERLPMETIYQQRERERLIEEQYNRISLSPESEKTAQSAQGGQALSGQTTPRISPPQQSTSEQVRDQATAHLQVPLYRTVLDQVTKSVLGISLDDLAKASETGDLPKSVINMNWMAPGAAIASDVFAQAAQQQAKDSGLPPEVVSQIGTTAGMLASILFPTGGFKKNRAGKAVEAAKTLSEETKGALQRFLAGEVPAEASKLNAARVGADASVKTTMTTLNKFNAERLATSRAPVSHAATVAASEGVMTIEKALKLPDADFVLDKDKGTALRDLYASVSTHLDQLKNRMLQGDKAVEGEFLDTFLIANELARKDELVGRGVARALEARKIQSEAGRAPISLADLQQLREKFGEMTGVSATTLAGMLDTLDARKKKTFLGLVGQGLSSGQNMLYEAWINALLSGPQTHAANTASNALTAAWAPGERFLAANLDFAADRSVFHGETAAMLYGVVEGMKKGLRASVKAMQTGVSEFGDEKVERVGAISAAGFGLNPQGALGSAADYLGALVRLPGRALMTEDAFFKALNYQMELHAYAYRTAMQEGGGPAWRRMRELVANPPPAVKARAEQFALVQTFNQDLGELGFIGQMGGGLMTSAEALPMGRVVLPFVRTPTNLLHFTTERTPLLNALSDTLRADIVAGGERRALAFGKVASGLMAAGGVASLAAAGLISGGGPSDKTLLANKRLTGWQPYSIQIDGTWYAYNRLDPLGMMVGIMADYADLAGEIPSDRRVEFAAAAGLAVSKNMLSKTYLQGLADLFEAMQDPEKGSEKYVRSLARSLVPGALRQDVRGGPAVLGGDPIARDTRALSEVQTLLNEIKAGIPGYSKDLPPRRNLWGDPIELTGGWGPDLISPIYTSPLKEDPVAKEIVRLKVPLALPQPIMFGGRKPRDLQFQEPRPSQEGVPLTPGEYDLMLTLTGRGLPGMAPLHDELEKFMRSEQYSMLTDGPDGTKALGIARIVNAYKTAARAAMLDPNINPGAEALQEQLEKKVGEKVKAMTPTPANTSPSPFDTGALLRSLTR